MNLKLERIMAVIEKIKSDCNDLKKKGLITERGQGQLDVIELIDKALKD